MQIAKKRSFFKKGFSFPLDYIQDGLTFCLDGEYNLGTKHGDCSNYVVDLINGIKVYPNSGTTITYTDKYFAASDNSGVRTSFGNNNQTLLNNVFNFINLNTPKTIEVCMRERNSYNWAQFYHIEYRNSLNTTEYYMNFANEEVSRAFYRYGERGYNNGSEIPGNDYSPVGLYTTSYINKIISTSIVRQSYSTVYKYANGVKNSTTSTAGRSMLPIIDNPNFYSSAFFGIGPIDIFSVRIYNTLLTDEQVQYNYQIDKSRFNIS